MANELNKIKVSGGPVLAFHHLRLERFDFEAPLAYNDGHLLGYQIVQLEESTEMQAPTSQRSIQRRSPVADPGPPPTVPARSVSPSGGPQPRTVSSAKSIPNGSTRRQNVSQDLEAESLNFTLPMMLTFLIAAWSNVTRHSKCPSSVPN
jgi:hypothetical protein